MTRLVAPLDAAERAAFIAEARTYLRVPFRHTGRSRRGVDCVGLVAVALAAVGRDVADRRDYGRDPVRDGLRAVLVDHFGEPVWRKGEPMEALQPGDVALMRWHEAGGVHLFNHVGILTDYPLGGVALLHALAQNREVVEHRLAEPWTRRVIEAFRP
jgi:cell wall-associated NlpC family hydrolase